MVGGRRKRRRKFVEVASAALKKSVLEGKVDVEKGQAIAEALNSRPPIVERIRSAFVGDVHNASPDALKSAGNEKGEIDFDTMFDLLANFFPKLAKFRPFAKLMADILNPKA